MTLSWKPHLFRLAQTLFLFSHKRFFLYFANCIWLIRYYGFGYLVAWFNCPPYSNAPESKNASVMYVSVYIYILRSEWRKCIERWRDWNNVVNLSPGICDTNKLSVKNYLQILQKPADTVSDSMWWLQINTSCEYFLEKWFWPAK